MKRIIVIILALSLTGVSIAYPQSDTSVKPQHAERQNQVDQQPVSQRVSGKSTIQNDLFLEIVEGQRDWANFTITAIGIIFLLATGLTITYQLIISKRRITQEIENEFERKMDDFNTRIENLVKENLEGKTKQLEDKANESIAEIRRLHGKIHELENPNIALLWYARAYESYWIIKELGMCNTMINFMDNCVTKIDKQDDSKAILNKSQFEEIIEIGKRIDLDFSVSLETIFGRIKTWHKELSD